MSQNVIAVIQFTNFSDNVSKLYGSNDNKKTIISGFISLGLFSDEKLFENWAIRIK